MSGERWRVVFTTVRGRHWADYRSEASARSGYAVARQGMWGHEAVLLHQQGDKFVQVAP